MKKEIKEYVNILGYNQLAIFCVSDCLYEALKDGVKELVLSEEEYDAVTRYFVYCGMWNWDKQSFMGMKFIVIKNLNGK